ncbi:hypothetical protein GH714_005060 [Hevea brasiliensis]|uniref:CobW/HypB/UreG nucleotide-binding domain-containing protein n=1 Tax=Hevea brasiliensis TaxID=3981 RepID=A0A6A6LWP6_HEVBR|nr:hypothetical protein GH714_005060 [Hevea brasiliensis]
MIFTKEDGEFLIKHGALPEERIRAVETGGCPRAAIREDISINLGLLEELSKLFKADLLLCESGGDKLLLGEAWTWCRGNCEPYFTSLRRSNWEEAALNRASKSCLSALVLSEVTCVLQ